MTCLVGKNESGKTAILQALYRLNPIVASESKFDVTEDYPRREVEEYPHRIEAKAQRHEQAITATFELDEDEVNAINAAYAEGVLRSVEVELSRG